MIISHENRFIFLKTRKTAGTSIDMALSRVCGPNDVISRLNREDEAVKESLGGRPARNVFVPYRHMTMRDAIKLLAGRRRTYTEHMSASSLKQRIERSVWKSYFKFCVERNPFDKAISLYYWRTRKAEVKPSVLEFLRSIDEASLSNFHIYAIGDHVEVDYIIRFEELDRGIEHVCDSLGLPPLELPHAKHGFRESGTHHRELMGPEERSIVETVCRREIELLGYTF